jgi:hypothetical protein
MKQATKLYIALCLLGITTSLILSKLPELCAIAFITGVSCLVMFGDFINYSPKKEEKDLENDLWEGTGHD